MPGAAYFIRRRGDECSVIKIHPDGREEILEHGLTFAEAETLYDRCIGVPIREGAAPEAADDRLATTHHRRPRQLAFKF